MSQLKTRLQAKIAADNMDDLLADADSLTQSIEAFIAKLERAGFAAASNSSLEGSVYSLAEKAAEVIPLFAKGIETLKKRGGS